MLGSIVCFAQALVVVRRLPPIHPVALNTVGMAASVPVLALAALARGEAFAMPTLPESWVAIAYVAAVGSVIVFLLQVFVVQHWTASRTSYVMVLIPIARRPTGTVEVGLDGYSSSLAKVAMAAAIS